LQKGAGPADEQVVKTETRPAATPEAATAADVQKTGVQSKTVDVAKTTAQVEGKPIPDTVVKGGATTPATVEPTSSPEVAPKGGKVLPGVAAGANALATVSAVKGIYRDLKDHHFGSAAVKTGLLGASAFEAAAPPLLAAGVIMNYWGDRHEAIEKDSFEMGDRVRDTVASIPLVGKIPYLPDIAGGLKAADTAVTESLVYTAKDMVDAVVDGAETVGGLVEDAGEAIGDAAEDVWDWITD